VFATGPQDELDLNGLPCVSPQDIEFFRQIILYPPAPPIVVSAGGLSCLELRALARATCMAA
jgi:hypothetical protein